MGIRLLNKLITKQCRNNKSCIRKIKMSELSGKRLVIDINVYLYDFASEDKLLKRVMQLCSLLNKYNIKVVFIFDGKPPKEKYAELERRKKMKIKIEEKYNLLKKEYDIELGNDINGVRGSDLKLLKIKNELNDMKRSCVSLTRENFIDVKNIITAFGMNYIIADGEADPLCSELVKNGLAYACVSQDMDMFVYKTPIIMRNLDLDNEELVVYVLNNILSTMLINYENFLTMCMSINTDYLKINGDEYKKHKNLFYYYKTYLKYKRDSKSVKDRSNYSFMDYLYDKKHFNFNELKKIKEIKQLYKKRLKIDIKERDLKDKPTDINKLCYYSTMISMKN